jgi:hypothetical protein
MLSLPRPASLQFQPGNPALPRFIQQINSPRKQHLRPRDPNALRDLPSIHASAQLVEHNALHLLVQRPLTPGHLDFAQARECSLVKLLEKGVIFELLVLGSGETLAQRPNQSIDMRVLQGNRQIIRVYEENFGEAGVLNIKSEELSSVECLINISLCGESKWTKGADMYCRYPIDR